MEERDQPHARAALLLGEESLVPYATGWVGLTVGRDVLDKRTSFNRAR